MSTAMKTALSLVLTLLPACSLGGGQRNDSGTVHATAPVAERELTSAAELEGVWRSIETAGVLDEVGRAYLYAFRAGGQYSAAILVDAEGGYEWITVGGAYHFAEGRLDLGEGTPSFRATRAGLELHLQASEGSLRLRPLFHVSTEESDR